MTFDQNFLTFADEIRNNGETVDHNHVERSGAHRTRSHRLQFGAAGNIFIRIGKSLIINRSYIYYINVPKQKLILSDIATFNHTVAASKEALKQLKELLEGEAK